MIGIVVVSHSRPLAEAAVALASEMVTGRAAPRMVVAAGIDSGAGPELGTDATAVADAVAEADSPAGVLVLMDVGSSVLSAQMALEFLADDLVARVRLSAAPLVEGLVAAVVAAAGGASLDQVAAQADAGLRAKRVQVGGEPLSGPGPSPDPPAAALEQPPRADAVVRDVVVTSPTGLHLRPAALLAGVIGSFDADVTVGNPDTGRGPVPGDSLADLLTLAAELGHRLHLEARGPQAVEALDAVTDLAEAGFEPPRSP